MNTVLYKLFAASFRFFSLFPLREKAALLSPHMAKFTDSLGEMEKEMARRGVRTVRVSGSDVKPDRITPSAVLRALRFFTVGAYRLVTSSVVFLNDNFMPLADLPIRGKAQWVQLWHAEGAFKRFGLDIPNLPDDVRDRVMRGNAKLRYVICSAKSVVPIYASAFGVPQEKVLPLGSPRADAYIRACREADTTAFRKKYFGETDKIIVLYAPTFRDDPAENRTLLSHFDFDAFRRELGGEYLLVLRLHPQFHDIPIPEDVCDMTGFADAGALFSACDLLVTDYSSVCLDFALLEKPCVFYAFDLDKYASDRSFYRDYTQYVPGPAAKTFPQLLAAIRSADADRDALRSFAQFNFDTQDGQCAARIADLVMQSANPR